MEASHNRRQPNLLNLTLSLQNILILEIDGNYALSWSSHFHEQILMGVIECGSELICIKFDYDKVCLFIRDKTQRLLGLVTMICGLWLFASSQCLVTIPAGVLHNTIRVVSSRLLPCLATAFCHPCHPHVWWPTNDQTPPT